MAQITYREALNQALREELDRDERVFIMGEEVGYFGGAFKVTDGLLAVYGEKRVRDFQLGAYVPLYGQEGKPANVVIHYEVEPAYFKQFTTAPHVRFSSASVRMELE